MGSRRHKELYCASCGERLIIEQHLLGELFHQYLNVEDGFITALFTTENHIGRVFVNEDALTDEHQLTILDYGRASEKGMLAELIFDNQAFASHHMMAAILGVILHLPPLKQTLASKQFQSRYLVRLIAWAEKRM